MKSLCADRPGNDTIDPYPLIPGEAKKILIVKKDIFQELRERYKAFCRSLIVQPVNRSSNRERNKRHFSARNPLKIRPRHLLAYQPSNAIATNECDYRRWCRVKEWFNQFGPEAEQFERQILHSIKMDT